MKTVETVQNFVVTTVTGLKPRCESDKVISKVNPAALPS